MVINFPEDLKLEAYLESLKVDGLFKDVWGRGQEETERDATEYWHKRRRSFTASLFDIRNDILKVQVGDTFTREQTTLMLDNAMSSVICMFSPKSIPDTKYMLNDYIFEVAKDDQGKTVINDNVRPTRVRLEDYWEMVNS